MIELLLPTTFQVIFKLYNSKFPFILSKSLFKQVLPMRVYFIFDQNILHQSKMMLADEDKNSQQIIINGSVLIIHGTIVPYAKQIIRSNDTMFVTDLGIEVPISEELRAYDEYYFHHMLKKQLLADIQSNHESIGLEILQELDLQAEHYEYLMSKISLKKLAKILMDDDFLMFLWNTFRKLLDAPNVMDKEESRLTLINLTGPLQRSIFLLKAVQECPRCTLKEKIAIVAELYIYDIIGQFKFVHQLAIQSHLYSEEQSDGEGLGPEADNRFLQKLVEYFVCLRYLSKNDFDEQKINEKYFEKWPLWKEKQKHREIINESAKFGFVKYQIFNKSCLNFIGKHFQHFVDHNRKDLLLTLSLIIKHNKQQFWNQMIEFAQEAKQKVTYELIDNSDNLRRILIHYFFNNDWQTWSQCETILMELNSFINAESMLVNLYGDLIQFPPLRINIIDLIIDFIKNTIKNSVQLSSNFKILVEGFLCAINSQVDQLYNAYNSNSQKIKGFQSRHLLVTIPKINSTMVCAIIRVFSLMVSSNLLNDFDNVNCQKSISNLITMVSCKYGATYGAMAQLVKLLKDKGRSQRQNIIQNQKPHHPQENRNHFDSRKSTYHQNFKRSSMNQYK